jgi:cyclopropane-fatty-acyl-phospholipid synthase
MAFNPELYLGEAYMDGRLTLEEGTLRDLFELAARNLQSFDDHPLVSFVKGLLYRGRWLEQYNPVGKAQRNVAHHYDLSSELYDLFLDRDRQYSCAYFTSPDDGLDAAQESKKRHLASGRGSGSSTSARAGVGSGCTSPTPATAMSPA